MGIKGGHSYTHSIKDVTLGEIFQIAAARKKSYNNTDINDNTNNNPTIDMDASWVYRCTAIAIDNRMSWLINLALEFVREGFNVVYVCDGEIRHHSKRASILRKSKFQRNIIDGYVKKAALMVLAEKRRQSTDLDEINQSIIEEEILSTKLKSLETIQQVASVNVGDDFFNNIKNAIELIPIKMKGNRNGSITVIRSKFQADSVLAHRIMNQESEIILCSDSDLAALAGSHCIGIKNFRYNEKNKTEKLSDIQIFTPTTSTLDRIIEVISLNPESDRIIKSKYNIFEEVEDIRIRGLLAIGLGCDVYLEGIPQIGKGTLKKFVDKQKTLTFDCIINFYYSYEIKNTQRINKKNKKNNDDNFIEIQTIDKDIFIDAMNIYVDSFIYEPINYYKSIVYYDEAPKFIIQNPNRLHEYIKDFGACNNDILIYESKNKLLTCTGVGSGDHIFLSYEKQYNCIYCHNLICKHCTITEDNTDYCYQCFTSETTVVPLTTVVNQPSLKIMRDGLSSIGIETANDDNFNDISDLFDATVGKEYMYTDQTVFYNIDVPKFPTSYLDSEKILFRFDLDNGGAFIRNTMLNNNQRIHIMDLLSKLIQSGQNDYSEKNNRIYSILPNLIIKLAERSRMHSGYRLLKRAVRHALDPEGINILTSNCAFVEYENIIGLHISHKIKASMKKDLYDVKLTFTSNDILACSCSCKAGSAKEEKILCVHILPVLLQLSLLLYDGMAEHLLCEIANEFPTGMEDNLNHDNILMLSKAIYLLKVASGKVDDSKNIILSIDTLLEDCKVGTESFKRGPGPPKDIHKLGPLRNISLMNPLTSAKNIFEKKEPTDNKNTITIIDNSNDTIIIPYKKIYLLHLFLINHFKADNKSYEFQDCIGYKLLKLRSEKDTYDNTKEMNINKKILLESFIDANTDLRFNKNKQIQKNLSVIKNDNNKQIEKNLSVFKNKGNNENSTLISENINNDNDTTTTNIKKKQTTWYTCCVQSCKATSTKSPTLTFMQIPKLPKTKNLETLSDNMLLTYQKKIFIRKEWLRRLGLNVNNPNQRLTVCSMHEIEDQDIVIKWKNILNIETHTTINIRMPKHKNEPPIRTRQQHLKRKEVTFPKFCQVIKEKKKKGDTNTNKNNIKINTISDNIPQQTTPLASENSIPFTSPISIKKPNRSKRYCAFVGCNVSVKCAKHETIKFYNVPKEPKALKSNASNLQRLRYSKRVLFRKLYFKNIGIDLKDNRKDLRVCNQHTLQTIKTTVSWLDIHKVKQSKKTLFNLPASPESVIDDEKKESKGLGMDRFIVKTINNAKENINQNDTFTWALSLQQSVAMNDEPGLVHRSVARAVGIDVHKEEKKKYSIIKDESVKYEEKNEVKLDTLNNKKVKNDTGFTCKVSMLTYTLVICNGDVNLMTSTSGKLSWLEEWYFFWERCYGRTSTRWSGYEQKYKRSESFLRILFDNKMKLVLTCRKLWPTYVSLKEDEELRNECWNTTYSGRRVVMWDNTSVHLPKPQNPEAQRNTFSQYYAGNVGKGAIFIQLCGWMGTYELWEGAVSDSDYFVRSGILQQQIEYVTTYDKEYKDINWINILDKGYRVTSAAWRTGKQFVLQPSFAKADQKFSSLETLRSAAIASDRGANERAVRLAKMSGQIHNGVTGSQSLERLSDLWLTWSFQCNFIYKPVL